jgi:uncharacterized membrane protein YfcA
MITDIDTTSLLLFFLCAALIGIGKAGVKGMGMLVVPLMAAIFGGRASAGLVLPMLCFADIFAVAYYNRHANWIYIRRLMPAALVGVLIGVVVGYYVDDGVFTNLISIIIIGSLVLMLIQERMVISQRIVGGWKMGSTFGLLGGFSTMIGNAAGPVIATYFLATKIPKNAFIGTAAWFYLIVNLVKVPMHVFIWGSITWDSFKLNLMAIPAIGLGILIGVNIVKLIPEKAFRYFVMIMTFLVSLKLLFG